MIALELTAAQRSAVDAPFDAFCTISGAAGTGKSTAQRARAARAAAQFPGAQLLLLESPAGLAATAAEILRDAGTPVRIVDDVDAEAIFERACAELFALDWEEFAREQLDPEVPGLRSPERFAESAYRLIRRLRDAAIAPKEFLARSLAGATEFYAKPPNFADPALFSATKDEHHDSLYVTPQELTRQYRREIDLAKILAKLYERYEALSFEAALLTGRDALARAAHVLQANAALARGVRERYPLALVDGAGRIAPVEVQLLQAMYAPELAGVTLCGEVLRGLPAAAAAIQLCEQHRSPVAIELACRRLAKSKEPLDATGVEPALTLYRARDESAEAAFVARRVERWIEAGTAPDAIAVILRTLQGAEPFERALLDRGIPVATGGDENAFTDRRALDALALLWNVHDPFRHDWLLRTLGNPAMALSDASLAALCSEPPHPQAPLFVLDDDEPAPTARSGRWDPKRDLRLGWNVIRGEQDDALSEEARARVRRFRAMREGWLDASRRLDVESFARLVWSEGLAREGEPGSARARAQERVLLRLLARLRAFLGDEAHATLAEVLDYAARRAQSDLETCEDAGGEGCVRLLSAEAAAGREFDYVVISNARAGGFPQWLVPEAFLYSPRLGMIPKENAGEARAARTAKFSYYMHANKTRDNYNDRERALFINSLRRARRGAIVTASGNPTKAVAAPEFLEELRTGFLPGTELAED